MNYPLPFVLMEGKVVLPYSFTIFILLILPF